MTRGLRSSTASTCAPLPRPACAWPQRNVRGQPHGSKRDLARARSPPLTPPHHTRRKDGGSVLHRSRCSTSSSSPSSYWPCTRAARPSARRRTPWSREEAAKRKREAVGWPVGVHIRYVFVCCEKYNCRKGHRRKTEGIRKRSVTFLVTPTGTRVFISDHTRQKPRWCGRAPPAGRAQARPTLRSMEEKSQT